MSERTPEEIATIFKNAGDSVNLINRLSSLESLTDEDKARIKRNVDHLQKIRGYTTEDGTSIWSTDYDFTEQDNAVILGKTKY